MNTLGTIRFNLPAGMEFSAHAYGGQKEFHDLEFVLAGNKLVDIVFDTTSKEDALDQMERLGEVLLKHVADQRFPICTEE